MFREMRRKKQQLSDTESRSILHQGSSGVLAVRGDAGYPYAVPLNYVYAEEEHTIYFHCAKSGHKLDAILANSKVSFCVIGMDQVIPERYTTHFRSVIVFGQAYVIEEAEEKRNAIYQLVKKYCPAQLPEDYEKEIESAWNALCIVGITIEHITGKKAIEQVNGISK